MIKIEKLSIITKITMIQSEILGYHLRRYAQCDNEHFPMGHRGLL